MHKTITGASEEYFGSVADGLIHAARLTEGGIFARKTVLPARLDDLMSYKQQHQLPPDIQQCCDEATRQGWTVGDRYFSPEKSQEA